MPACHAGGHGFESRTHRQSLPRCVSSAWLECLPVTQEVTGSSPVRTAERDLRVSFCFWYVQSLTSFPLEVRVLSPLCSESASRLRVPYAPQKETFGSLFAFGTSSLSPRSLLRSGFFLRFALKALRDYESRTHRRKRPEGLFFVFGAFSLSPRSLLSSCYTYVAYGTYKPYEKAFQPPSIPPRGENDL